MDRHLVKIAETRERGLVFARNVLAFDGLVLGVFAVLIAHQKGSDDGTVVAFLVMQIFVAAIGAWCSARLDSVRLLLSILRNMEEADAQAPKH